jgi:cytoskeletal protein CcmA (bactofilin family)
MAEIRSRETTVIGSDARFKGEMAFDGAAKILGQFEGTITAGGEIEIGPGAKCKAAIEAANVILDGAVDGNVTGHDKVQLTANAKLNGDLIAKTLIIAEGAAFVGHCRVGSEAGGKSNGSAAVVETKASAPEKVAAKK